MNRAQAVKSAKRRWGKHGHAERRGSRALVGWIVRQGVSFFHVVGEGRTYAEAFAEVDRSAKRDERYAAAMRAATPCERCGRRLGPQWENSRHAAKWSVDAEGRDELICKGCKDLERFGEYLGDCATHYVLALKYAARQDTDARMRLNSLRRAARLWEQLDPSGRAQCARVLKRLGLRVHDHEFWEGAERPRWRPNERPTET